MTKFLAHFFQMTKFLANFLIDQILDKLCYFGIIMPNLSLNEYTGIK